MAPTGLKYWSNKLGRQDMPALAGVIKELNELTGSDDSEVNQLADVILKDANLTSQVLRIANSVHYNPSNTPINTVSRAIVLIGFGGVRAICISVMVIDSLLGAEPRERLLKTMAGAFHAAVQARNIVRRTNDAFKEEVFVAALLYRIGEMAFWSCGGESADELEGLLKTKTLSEKEAISRVLGTSLKSITRELAGAWNLGETLTQALNSSGPQCPKTVAVILGDKLSRAAENGWDSPGVGEILAKVSKFTGVGFAEGQQMAMDAADEAASVALTYGASRVCHLIPSSSNVSLQEQAEEVTAMQADPKAQLNILRELSNALGERIDVNTLFQMVIEGMHRGVGLERVCVAFIVKGCVQAKYVLGEGAEEWRENFQFSVTERDESIFTHAMTAGEAVWFKGGKEGAYKHLYSPEVLEIIGPYPSFVSVVQVNGRNVAMFYADRWNRGGTPDQEQFESFRHFALQAKLNLEMLSRK